MADLNETTILQEGPVKVTNAKAIIGTITYPLSQIKAVKVTRRGRSIKPFLLAIPGIVFVSWSLMDQTGQFVGFCIIGNALILTGIAIILMAKPTYAVQIGSAFGESTILRSTDITFVQRIADAMNKAIAHGK